MHSEYYSIDEENATIINKEDYEHYLVECSGEFPVVKQCEVQNSERDVITPFIRVMNRMMNEVSYERFVNRYHS